MAQSKPILNESATLNLAEGQVLKVLIDDVEQVDLTYVVPAGKENSVVITLGGEETDIVVP